MHVGVFPIRNHYYEPQFDFRELRESLSESRSLPGINWNVPEQLSYLENLSYADELQGIPSKPTDTLSFYFNNGKFESGDAEYWYQLVRHIKPGKIFEIGSGNSTLMAIKGIERNRSDNPDYVCRHVCIEPYEMPWLEKSNVEVIREKIEDVEIKLFSELQANDVLFIDSSHVIRPRGDVLMEYLEILPTLNEGVIVHIHDIFSPKDYPEDWLANRVKFWNEQYLLEAFLTHNSDWKVLGALNYLHHTHYDSLKSVAPYLTPEREPGSLYLQKTN